MANHSNVEASMFKQTILLAALLLLSVAGFQEARAQSDERKFEVGGQFSLIRPPTQTTTISTLPCLGPLPCPFSLISAAGHETEPGFGGRLGYNFSRYFALEAEGNFFPRDRIFEGGRKTQGLFGAKIGKRFDKAGLFAKARPGFVRFSKGDYQQVGVCIAVFPPPAACFQPEARTNFAFDLGGVAEWYPSKNTIVRFDAGDTIIRFGARNVTATDIPSGGLVVVPAAAETRHNFQGSVGFGFRF
jgi:hypothetical protein